MLADLQLAVLDMTAKEQISNCMVIDLLKVPVYISESGTNFDCCRQPILHIRGSYHVEQKQTHSFSYSRVSHWF